MAAGNHTLTKGVEATVDQQWPPRDKIVCGSMLDHIMSGSASRCLITQSPRTFSCLITQTRGHAVKQTCCLITQSRTPRSLSCLITQTRGHAVTQTCCLITQSRTPTSDHADTQTCCHADMLSDRAVSYPKIPQPRVSRSHSLVSSPTARRACAFNPDPAVDSKSVPRMRRTDSERMRRKICKICSAHALRLYAAWAVFVLHLHAVCECKQSLFKMSSQS
jgi:hypothetical protein